MSGGDFRLAELLARALCCPNVPFDGDEYGPVERPGDVDREVSWEYASAT